jgi:hypothetical protein
LQLDIVISTSAFSPQQMAEHSPNVVLVRCLSCRHKALISERDLATGVKRSDQPIRQTIAMPQMRQPKRDGQTNALEGRDAIGAQAQAK